MSEINVDVRATLDSGQMSQDYEYMHQGDSKRNPVSGKRVHSFPSRHISRKELFYNKKGQQQVQALQELHHQVFEAQPQVSSSYVSEFDSTSSFLPMHPEEVEMASHSDAFHQAKLLKSPEPECVEEHIDVESCSVNGSSNGKVNGNGFNEADLDDKRADVLEFKDEEALADSHVSNGEELPVVTSAAFHPKRSRQHSTSSRSSSVSSALSVKQQAGAASLLMDVSIDEEVMESLILKGSAEELEVSTSFTAVKDGGLDSEETSKDNEIADQGYPEELDACAVEDSEAQINAPDIKSRKSSEKGSSQIKLKSSKPKKTKQSSHQAATIDIAEEPAIEVDLEDPEKKKTAAKNSKSPSRRSKTSTSKQDQKKGDEKGDSDSGPRRSSRPRQTPQKYNASLFLDYSIDSPEEHMNSSEAGFGVGVRSVRGRRSLRKSRNISALDNSLHNDSSPWDNEFKVLTPSGGPFSLNSSEVEENMDYPAPGKRKADEEDEEDEHEAKKVCLEESVNGSFSSQTLSFFSVVTSPFNLLKNKLQRRSVSSSTPIKTEENKGTDSDSGIAGSPEDIPQTEAVPQAPDVQGSARSWCSIM